jgi:hypothetical protein
VGLGLDISTPAHESFFRLVQIHSYIMAFIPKETNGSLKAYYDKDGYDSAVHFCQNLFNILASLASVFRPDKSYLKPVCSLYLWL